MKSIYIILWCVFITLSARGQEAKNATKEERLQQIEEKLSVTRVRAVAILEALDYHVEEIRNIARDPNLSAQHKRYRLSELQAGRQANLLIDLAETNIILAQIDRFTLDAIRQDVSTSIPLFERVRAYQAGFSLLSSLCLE